MDNINNQKKLIKDTIVSKNIVDEMKNSFIDYAMSVIVSRALPDARDGFKPVHRRIIFAMNELGMTHDKPHKKSARVVGEVIAKYHPHGDQAAYNTLVRMAQDFSLRYTLVDGHGNFGSVDGDSAAAMRYTESRMSKISNLLISDINKNTVNFVENYDGAEKEPTVLPSRIPNLLINGSSGIAVGMATSIPPHNLNEVIEALIALANNPEITITELSTLIKGPDFPFGAIILGDKGIKEAYATGKGAVLVRSRTHIETLDNHKQRIIVTELPYMVNKAMLVEKIANLAKNKIIDGITDLRDESSLKGIRVVIEIRRDAIAEIVLNKLFKLTPLQTSFNINMLALVEGKPEILNLKKLLSVYLSHRKNILIRKTTFELTKARKRCEILEGLTIALKNIDPIIKLIKSTKSTEEAVQKLITNFPLNANQAKAVLEMRLQRLTGLEQSRIELELNKLLDLIKEYENILNNKSKVIIEIIKDLEYIKATFGDERRSEIISGDITNIDDEELIPKESIVISLSSKGYIKRLPIDEYRVQNRGGTGSKGITLSEDIVSNLLITHTHSDLLLFSNLGRVYRLRAYQIPQASKQAKGIPVINILPISKNLKEKITVLLRLDDYDQGSIIFVTKKGVVKKTFKSEFSNINKNGKIAISLDDDDNLLFVKDVDEDTELLIGATNGKVAHFKVNVIRNTGRSSRGVIGMRIADDAEVIGCSTSLEGNKVLAIGSYGFGKVTNIDSYRITNRGSKGVQSINVNKAGKLICLKAILGNEDILIITKKGIIIRILTSQIKETISRSSKGVRIIKLRDNDEISSVAMFKNDEIDSLESEVTNLETN